jgi:hypothetical protein
MKQKIKVEFNIRTSCHTEIEVDIPEGKGIAEYVKENEDALFQKASEELNGKDITDEMGANANFESMDLIIEGE